MITFQWPRRSLSCPSKPDVHLQPPARQTARCRAIPNHGSRCEARKHQQSQWSIRLASLSAASLCGLFLQCQCVEAAPLQQHLVSLDSSPGNTAILRQLKQLQQTKERFGSKDPGTALAARFTAVQQQLQRIELLVKIQDYDNARMQLREGPFKNLRADLRYEQEYRGVEPQLTRSVVEGVERLDGQLKRREPVDSISPGLQQLQQQLLQLGAEDGQQQAVQQQH